MKCINQDLVNWTVLCSFRHLQLVSWLLCEYWRHWICFKYQISRKGRIVPKITSCVCTRLVFFIRIIFAKWEFKIKVWNKILIFYYWSPLNYLQVSVCEKTLKIVPLLLEHSSGKYYKTLYSQTIVNMRKWLLNRSKEPPINLLNKTFSCYR